MTIEHIAITTADIDRLRRFYSTYFGMEAEAEITGSTGSRITFMHSPDGGARIELMQKPQTADRPVVPPLGQADAQSGERPATPPCGQTGTPPCGQTGTPPCGYAHLAFAVGSEDAVSALIQRLAAAGVTILRQPKRTPSGTLLATIADPDGNPLEIVP